MYIKIYYEIKIDDEDNLEPGEKGIVAQVTHAVHRISDGQIAWRVGYTYCLRLRVKIDYLFKNK